LEEASKMKKIILILLFSFISCFAHPTPIEDLKDLISIYNIEARIEENLEYKNLYIYIEKTSEKNFTILSNTITVAISRSIELIKFDINKYETIIISNGEKRNSEVIIFTTKDIKSILTKNNLKRIK
jgi:hypothetical protein